MKENFKDKNVILNPDTVLYLNNTIHDNKFKREYIMTCLRNDKESVLGSNKEKLITDLKRNHGQVVEFDTVINKTVTKEEREKELNKMLINFQNKDCYYQIDCTNGILCNNKNPMYCN